MNPIGAIGLPLIAVLGFDFNFWGVVATFLVWVFALIAGFCALASPVFLLISAPLRRQERAAMLLDLVESGLRDGRTPAQTITSVAEGVRGAMGLKFLVLSTYIQDGFRLSEALGRVRGLVPPQLPAMLAVGEETGDIEQVLPACRGFLRDGGPQVRGSVNYLPVMLLYLIPSQLLVLGMIAVFILPKFRDIAMDMGLVLSGYSGAVFQLMEWLLPLLAWLTLTVMAAVAVHVFSTVHGGTLPCRGLVDRVNCWLPWRRFRLHRDFCSLLGSLLDGGVAEERSVLLAARGTGNTVFMRKAEMARRDLAQGVRLTDALQRLDPAGEFRWRLGTASHGSFGFSMALAGWCEALDAKAFQREQAISQLVASGFVLWSGLVIGLVTSGIFMVLIGLIEEGLLW